MLASKEHVLTHVSIIPPPCSPDAEGHQAAVCVFLETYRIEGLKRAWRSKSQLFPTVISKSSPGHFQWHLLFTLDYF